MQFLDKTVNIPSRTPSHIAIVGCGSVGSFLSLVLAKISDKITLIDKDTIEPHNIPTHTLIKPFLSEQTPKALAVKLMLDAMTFANSAPLHADVGEVNFADLDFSRELEIIVLATDTVQSRIAALKNIQQAIDDLPSLKRIIDTGIDANGYRIAVIKPEEVVQYMTILQDMPERQPDQTRACERVRNFPVILSLANAVMGVILSLI